MVRFRTPWPGHSRELHSTLHCDCTRRCSGTARPRGACQDEVRPARPRAAPPGRRGDARPRAASPGYGRRWIRPPRSTIPTAIVRRDFGGAGGSAISSRINDTTPKSAPYESRYVYGVRPAAAAVSGSARFVCIAFLGAAPLHQPVVQDAMNAAPRSVSRTRKNISAPPIPDMPLMQPTLARLPSETATSAESSRGRLPESVWSSPSGKLIV
jgi:hypothetical protein